MEQVSRFLTVGVFNTLIGYFIIFFCMYLVKMSPETSNFIGYGVGLIFSYFLNRIFTFHSSQDRINEFGRFLVVFALAYGANYVALLILIHKLRVNPGVSQVLAGVVYVTFSFILNKFYVFRGAHLEE
jgi:putative flippase GtrA